MSTASMGSVGRRGSALPVLLAQQPERARTLLAGVEDARAVAQTDPPQAAPVLVVGVDEDRHGGARPRVLDPPQPSRALRLAVDRGVQRVGEVGLLNGNAAVNAKVQ
jgi:hypothetical protein